MNANTSARVFNQKLALYNATTLLVAYGFVPSRELVVSDRIDIAGENVSYGHLLSLSWYSILLSLCAREIAIWTKFEKKDAGLILMDLLPGDDTASSRNLNIVRHLIKKSILDGLFEDAVKNNHLKHIAFGYGSKEGSTRGLKNSPPSTISDWITQSFYCKLKCEKIFKDESYETNMTYTKLADYLINKKFFLVDRPFTLTE